MSLKTKFLDIRQLKLLSDDLKYIASKKLTNTLVEYIASTRDGNYLCNIFSDTEMRELEEIDKNFVILSLL